MNLNQLELLRVLQETHFNLSKAAEKMFVVQSAVSRQLQLLEGELGAPVFERQGKKLVGLTPLGERIMEEVTLINLSKRNIQAIAEDFLHNRGGELHIATTHTQAKYFLPEPIRNFRDKYPNIKIYIVQSSPTNLIDLLHHHQADIAICTEKLNEEDDKLIIKPCYQWHHVAVMPKGHPLSKGEITLNRLANYPTLTYSKGYTGRSNIEKALAKTGVHLDIALEAADSDIIKTYVRIGLGVGIIAATAFEPQEDLDLVARDLGHLIPPSVTRFAYLKQMYLPSFFRFFIDELMRMAELKKAGV